MSSEFVIGLDYFLLLEVEFDLNNKLQTSKIKNAIQNVIVLNPKYVASAFQANINNHEGSSIAKAIINTTNKIPTILFILTFPP
jgi:hypothetical protein